MSEKHKPTKPASAVQGEPVAHAVFADNGNIRIWCADPIQAKTLMQVYGDQVRPLYTALQPAERPVSWIRISGDHVVLSRCDWMYPASTEDSAGPRDEQRFTAVGRRDGDIVLPAPEGSLDREDLKTMLAWPSASKPAEQQPDVTQLVEALEKARDAIGSLPQDALGNVPDTQQRQGWHIRDELINEISTALAAYRKTGGDA